MKKIIQVSGKANRVFKYVELLSRHKGKMTMKDLDKDNRTIKLDLR